MITQSVKVNGRNYTITLSEQTTMLATRLRKLYTAGYGDVESFDQISSAISTTINDLKRHSVNPEPRDDDLDGVMQALLKLFEKKEQKEQ